MAIGRHCGTLAAKCQSDVRTLSACLCQHLLLCFGRPSRPAAAESQLLAMSHVSHGSKLMHVDTDMFKSLIATCSKA